MAGYVPLHFWDIVLASLALLLHGGVSVALSLGLARTMLLAALRMVAQLFAVGLVLAFLFRQENTWLTLGVALFMVLFAGYEAMARQDRRLAGFWGYGLGASAMLLASWTLIGFALAVLIQPEPVTAPRYVVPLLGMVLGNCMTGVAIGLNHLLGRAEKERGSIEAMLALGYPRREALRPLVREAMRAGLIPIVNSMAATGLVSLPGMMTGQILAGMDPAEAVKYQMMIMFLIAGGTALGVTGAVLGAAWRLSDSRHRLRLDRLTARSV